MYNLDHEKCLYTIDALNSEVSIKGFHCVSTELGCKDPVCGVLSSLVYKHVLYVCVERK